MAVLQYLDENRHDTQYSIYVHYDHPGKTSNPSWEMKGITKNEQEAIDNARLFFDTSQFIKVEVKKRVYDTLNAQSQDVTIKIFQKNERQKGNVFKAFLALVAVVFVVAGSYYLDK